MQLCELRCDLRRADLHGIGLSTHSLAGLDRISGDTDTSEAATIEASVR